MKTVIKYGGRLLHSVMLVLLLIVFTNKANEVYECENKIKEQNEIIEEQKALISSYASYYSTQNCGCDCGWYEDFYYEHAAELGAYE